MPWRWIGISCDLACTSCVRKNSDDRKQHDSEVKRRGKRPRHQRRRLKRNISKNGSNNSSSSSSGTSSSSSSSSNDSSSSKDKVRVELEGDKVRVEVEPDKVGAEVDKVEPDKVRAEVDKVEADNVRVDKVRVEVEADKVRITCHEDMKSGLIIELPFNHHHVVWNDVSDDSFQVIVVALDMMHRVFTGSQFTKTMAMVNFDVTQPMVNFRSQWADLKCVEPGIYNRLRLEFHDTRC